MPSALETIAACPLLVSLNDKQRGLLAQDLVERRIAAGETITSQDSGGIAFFLIGEGSVGVTIEGVTRATLGPGDSFGEVGLLTGEARTATLVAETDVQCWTLSRWLFKPLVTGHPEVAWSLLEKLAHHITAVRA